MTLLDRAWQDEAACVGENAELFFPGSGESHREAKELCKVCPVRLECLEFALSRHERFGTWGGLGERERERVWKQRRRNRLSA